MHSNHHRRTRHQRDWSIMSKIDIWVVVSRYRNTIVDAALTFEIARARATHLNTIYQSDEYNVSKYQDGAEAIKANLNAKYADTDSM